MNDQPSSARSRAATNVCPSCGAPLPAQPPPPTGAVIYHGVTPDAAVAGDASPPPAHATTSSGVVATWLRTAGPQTLLAAGGVLLLVVAAIVFTAVAWRDLSAAVRGGMLAAAAVGSAGVTRLLTARGLERTAEATAVLSVALLGVLADAMWRGGVFGGIDGLTVLTVSTAGLAGYSHVLATVTRTRAPRVLAGWQAAAAVGSGGLRLADGLGGRWTGLDVAVVAGGLLAAATVAAVYARHRLGDLPRWRAVTDAGAFGWWSLSSLMAVALLWFLDAGTPGDRAGLVAGGVVAALAVWVALLARRLGMARSRWEPAGAGGAWLVATAAGAAVVDPPLTDWQMARFLLPVMLGSVALWTLRTVRARRGAAVGMLPIVTAALVPWMALSAWLVDVAAARLGSPWTGTLRLGATPDVATLMLAVGATAVIAVLALAVGRRDLAAIGGVVGGASVFVGGAVMVWPAGGGVVATIAIAGAAAGVMHGTIAGDVRLGATVVLVAVALSGVALALVGALATIVTLSLMAAAAAAGLSAALRGPVASGDRVSGGDTSAPAAVLRADVVPLLAALLAADLIGLVAAVVAALTDRWGPAGVGVTVAAAAAWLLTGLVVHCEKWVAHRERIVVPVDVTAAVGFAVGIGAAAIDVAAVWQAVAFAALAVAAGGMVVLRDDRAWMRWVATVAASAASWTLLADANIETVEAYTMPPAVLMLAMGGVTLWQRARGSSWRALGPGLGLLLTPTVATVLDDPDDLRRLLAVIVMGSVLAVVGRVGRLQAPLVAGLAALVVVALTQVDAVTDIVPRWMLLATGGSLLLWLSISYERQMQRLSALRSGLAQMR